MPYLLSRSRAHALNAICPYFSMFPLEYPVRVLAHTAGAAGVLDPFCGRGTTLYAARCAGRRAYGLDTNPVAVAIARAKLACTTSQAVLERARELLAQAPAAAPDDEFFRQAYHRDTLEQLATLRQGLLAPHACTPEHDVLRAAALGCLHGPLPREATQTAYFSNHMLRTVASKPRSNLTYWARTGLTAPRVDVAAVLARKLARMAESLTRPSAGGAVCAADARDPASYRDWAGMFDTVITSPPYYGLRSYVPDQWLRAWFLGGPPAVQYGPGAQLAHGSVPAYIAALGAVWAACSQAGAARLSLHVRFGDIPSKRLPVRAVFAQSLEASGVCWRERACVPVRYERGARQARQMAAGTAPFEEFDFHVERD